jgi:Mrp family chromosome partitioning ATPase
MEACRVLRLNLQDGPGGAPAPLVVLSQAPERSCALVSAGLALALAQEGRRVLLVDASPQEPSLHTLFNLGAGPGFAELLEGGAAAGVTPTAVGDGLWVLPAGSGALRPGPEALAPATAHLAAAYDTVIYHATALARSTTALQLARQVGTLIFTVRAGVDRPEPLRRMREALERAGVTVLGFALVEERP